MTAKNEKQDVNGVLEIVDKGHGFLRQKKSNFANRPVDPFVSVELIKSLQLRSGLEIDAVTQGLRGRNPVVIEIKAVNGRDPDEIIDTPRFDQFTVVDPSEMIRLETEQEPIGTRIMDMFTPIGKGQRGLIVAAPRTGKTILLQQIAKGLAQNHPEIHVLVLLIDERPEEVTEMRRSIEGEVIASSNDKLVDSHVHTAQIALEYVKRRVEFGQDVVVLLDSITRLGRAFNSWTKNSGRTMSGGIDIRALQLPKQLFGSARNCEEGGSLTIIATALIETGSRMDDIIFQEFKGTGNMELVLDRNLAYKRIYPSINIEQSGTRKEERLIPKEDLEKIFRLRRHLSSLPVGQDVETLVRTVKKHPSNRAFIDSLP